MEEDENIILVYGKRDDFDHGPERFYKEFSSLEEAKQWSKDNNKQWVNGYKYTSITIIIGKIEDYSNNNYQ